jgi:hypothetical protein
VRINPSTASDELPSSKGQTCAWPTGEKTETKQDAISVTPTRLDKRANEIHPPQLSTEITDPGMSALLASNHARTRVRSQHGKLIPIEALRNPAGNSDINKKFFSALRTDV